MGFFRNTALGLLMASMVGTNVASASMLSGSKPGAKGNNNLEQMLLDDGRIRGKVIDSKTGEELIGANIIVVGTQTGTSTDMDGMYQIKNLTEGEYNLKVSYISYKPLTIEKVNVIDGQDIKIDVALEPASEQLEEVIVTAEALKNSETGVLNIQRNSANIIDGLSAQQIKKSTDATTADALRRVSGITLSEDKFVYVRGTSERYTGALLNNSPLASTEPDRKSFAFDLIPSNLIENSLVIKSFTPDNPGNFAGGLIKVNTMDFPPIGSLNFNYSSSYVPGVTTKSIDSYQGGKNDYIGFDDGTRALPDNFPPDISVLKRDSVYKFAKLMSDKWAVDKKKAPINQNFALSYGDVFTLFDQELGIVSSLSYRSAFNNSNIKTRDPGIFDLVGTKSDYSVLWGTLLNLSYKLNDFNKVGFRNSFTVNSDDQIIQLDGPQYDKSLDSKNTALRFISRTLYSGQVFGESYIPVFGGVRVDWRGSYSKSHRDEPDYRRYTYGRNLDSDEKYSILLSQQPTLGLGGRYYSELNENNRASSVDLSFPISNANVKLGASYENADRSFGSRLISIVSQPYTAVRLYYYDIDSVFSPKNFSSGGFNIAEYTNGTNNYTSRQENVGAYFMFDLPFDVLDQNFRVIAGLRNEIATQRLRTLDISRRFPIIVDRLETDLLPSVNLIYSLNDDMNLRASFTRTINRPEFREIAPFAYYDFETQTSLEGNEELVRANISNYDLRYEIYPSPGEIVSLSLFYKEIMNAIEKVVIPTSFGEARSYANAPFARNYGFEIEARTSLNKLSSILSNFSVIGNYTWVKSEIDDVNSQFSGESKRALQGQSPYIINLALNYTNKDLGASATVSFNKIGRRILEVANQYNDNVYEEPRDLVDMVLTKKISDYMAMKFSIKDILAKEQAITQQGEIIRSFEKHPTYSLGISLDF